MTHSETPIDSATDETTVVTRVGLPKIPPEYKGTYFEDMTRVMATFVEEVRGYRADLKAQAAADETNWTTIKHEISGVRHDFSTVRQEIESAKRESDSKIKALEERVEQLGAEVVRLNARIETIGHDGQAAKAG